MTPNSAANRSDHRFQPGDRVEYGTSARGGRDRLGEVVGEARDRGEDGYDIRPLSGEAEEGSLPTRYPAHLVQGETPGRWAYEAHLDRYQRTGPADAQRPARRKGRATAGSLDDNRAEAV